MKSGEVPFKLGDPFSQPPFKFVIRGEDDSARSRLFRFFLFPGIVHEIGMRFRFFFVSSLFHYLAGVPPTPSPSLSARTLQLDRIQEIDTNGRSIRQRECVRRILSREGIVMLALSNAAATVAPSSLLGRRGRAR